MKEPTLDPRTRAPTPPWVVGTTFRGLDQLRRRLTGGAPLLASTSSEPLCGTLWIASLGHFGLTGGTLDAPAYCAGLCPPDAMSGTVVLAAPDGGQINGAPLEEGGLLLFPPGGLYEGWSPRGYRWVSAFFPKSEARRLVRAADVPPARLGAASVRQARLRADDLAALRAQIDDLEFERQRAAPAPLPEKGGARTRDGLEADPPARMDERGAGRRRPRASARRGTPARRGSLPPRPSGAARVRRRSRARDRSPRADARARVSTPIGPDADGVSDVAANGRRPATADRPPPAVLLRGHRRGPRRSGSPTSAGSPRPIEGRSARRRRRRSSRTPAAERASARPRSRWDRRSIRRSSHRPSPRRGPRGDRVTVA